jgi:hypothetical protein
MNKVFFLLAACAVFAPMALATIRRAAQIVT